MIGWTFWNYMPALLLIVTLSFTLSAIITHFSSKRQTVRAGLIAIFGMAVMLWGVIGLVAAPMDSAMQRNYWEEKLYIEWADEGVISEACDETIYLVDE